MKGCIAVAAGMTIALASLSNFSAWGQGIVLNPVAAACRVRTSVLQNYAPFQSAVPAGEKLLAATNEKDARGPVVAFDRALAGSLDNVPNEEAAVFALTDAERIIEMIMKCADATGVSRDKTARAAASLDAAYHRNLTTMQRPDFAERLLRSPRARAVLLSVKGGDAVVTEAQAVQAANNEARRQARLAEARAAEQRRVRIEAEWQERERQIAAADAERRRVIEAPIRAHEKIWRANMSAPPSSATLCNDNRIYGYSGRPKDADWLMLMEAEVGKCARISDRNDGPFFMGLALGTPVSDEQLAHASGRALICLSTSDGKQLLDSMSRLTDQLYSETLGKTGMRAQPVWSERMAGNRRIVQVKCDLTMTIFGIDLHKYQQALAGGLDIDGSSFVEYELVGGILSIIRTHLVLSNTVRTDISDSGQTSYCDNILSQADSVAAMQRAGGWHQNSMRSWTYMMKNNALAGALAGPQSRGNGRWYTMQRGSVLLDIYNTRYTSPSLGKNGDCGGGAVDRFAMLAATRARRVQAGTSIPW